MAYGHARKEEARGSSCAVGTPLRMQGIEKELPCTTVVPLNLRMCHVLMTRDPFNMDPYLLCNNNLHMDAILKLCLTVTF
jgi:hypothetical protein